MKVIISKIDKSKMINTMIYKGLVYVCWYLFAIVSLLFLNNKLTDAKILGLTLCIIIIYTIRSFFKYLYKRIANDNYHSIKHNIELYYFNKLKSNDIKDPEKVADLILKTSYNITKLINDIGEYLIPLVIGLLITFIELFKVNIIISIILLIVIIYFVYNSYKEEKENGISYSNYNDLLKDFVLKIDTIKKLNIFDSCAKKIKNNKDNDIVILKNNNVVNDIKYNNIVFAMLSVVLIAVYFSGFNNLHRLGLSIFFIIIFLKLKKLMCYLVPAIINYFDLKKNKFELDYFLTDNSKVTYENNWSKLNVVNGIVNYKSGVDINIPNFEIKKGDQIGIMGKSGQGKSTILKVINDSSYLTQGEILVDDKKQKGRINSFYVSTTTEMFNLSIRDNLLLGSKKNDSELISLIKEIGLNDWFNKLPDGLDTVIDNHYVVVDDTTREKLNILRAVISERDIYLFDEVTIDLEIEEETVIANIVKKYFKNKTIIVVTQRTVLSNLCKKHYFIKEHTLLEKEPLL